MAPDVDVLASPVRRAIIEALAGLPTLGWAGEPTRDSGLSTAELASLLDLHITTVRFHLDRLASAGLVTGRDERVGVGRPRKVWTAPADDPPDNDGYRLLAAVLVVAIASNDPDPVEAGRRWARDHAAEVVGSKAITRAATSPGTWLGKVGIVVDVLHRWGYEPSVELGDEGRSATVCLHHCPLRDLALDNQAITCGVHRGLIAGTLEALNEPPSSVDLDAFVTPDLCVARITRPAPEAAPNQVRPERPRS